MGHGPRRGRTAGVWQQRDRRDRSFLPGTTRRREAATPWTVDGRRQAQGNGPGPGMGEGKVVVRTRPVGDEGTWTEGRGQEEGNLPGLVTRTGRGETEVPRFL